MSAENKLEPACGDCIYFVNVPTTNKGIVGSCHRYPPKQGRWGLIWPHVQTRDWCGEFSSKKEKSD